jgi:DNA-directed RNA polymerase II subunit RPB1
MVCEPDEPKEEGEGAENEEPMKGHGGCGHIQPQIRKEGLKLFVQYKKPKDDDKVCKTWSVYCDADVTITLGDQVATAR